jgi:M6 family metalloprotease-like protein
MKRFLAISATALLLAVGLAPATAATKYSVNQKTLATFSSTATGLTSMQKAQVKATVEANPNAEKFICTGIRYYSQPMSVNIMVRKRAKAACEYAKQLNPSLSTWYQNKPTQARSYAGKVLLTVKSPDLRSVATQFGVDSEICKLKENSRTRALAPSASEPYSNATAFPFEPTILPIEGQINVRLIFVDWADSVGGSKDYEYYKEQIKMFEDFYWMASEHKLDMNVTASDQWFRIPGSYKEFTMTQLDEAQSGYAPKKQAFYDAAVAASDSATDYSNTDIVFFAIPTDQSVFLHGGPHEFNWIYNGYLKTAEKDIYDIASAGDWFINNEAYEPPWVYYVHETGHMIGIPHQSNEDLKDGSIIHLQNPLSGYDIMANQGGASRTINSWLRWLAGWIDDEQVICLTEDSVTDQYFELNPINTVEGKVESLVIKLSDTEAVVVESRRFDEYFDRATSNSKDGLLVYTIDATKSTAQGSQALLSPRDITKYIDEKSWRTGHELDAVFFQGDSVEIGGITIEATSIGADSDVVRVYRTSSK